MLHTQIQKESQKQQQVVILLSMQTCRREGPFSACSLLLPLYWSFLQNRGLSWSLLPQHGSLCKLHKSMTQSH